MATISVLGLGYVGCVSAACLAMQGHRVLGVDVNCTKVDLINNGKSPVVEKQLDDLIAEVVGSGRLTASTDALEMIGQSDISLICVGTPGQANGNLDLQYVRNVSRQIGRALRERESYHSVVVRSTVLPGSIESSVVPLLEEESGKEAGRDFGVYIYPEFLREGSAIEDYHHPPVILIGSWHGCSADHLAELHQGISAPIFATDIRTAEMVKYVSNAFHALKVTFANEIGTICKAMNIDSHQVMHIFTQDTQLNISSRYLQPGFAFGGSCLPKDLRALVYRVKTLDLESPVLKSVLVSNEQHIDHAFQIIQRSGRKKVGIIGLSFKAGTDDLRESPLVQLVEKLIGKGYDLRIYDKEVSIAKVMGANKQYIEQMIPHISMLLVPDIEEILAHAELVVIGKAIPQLADIMGRITEQQQIVDLARVEKDLSRLNGNYQGICW